ncbi:hypothetical protein B4U80_06437 [Leptotrombidium deliense]|uniref:TIL domain-containing protein n=1 Tax=Leptotrombidium deliense TaxID=299467 RepID=A0A443RYJ6_9ACAR|nr:hypothetical protein B4U80_06437 [Leptotrombidium deliense]
MNHKSETKLYFIEAKCPANQVFDFCGTACQTTCANRDETNRPCPRICVAGCRCKDGFVLNGTDCIKPEKCPTTKPELRPRRSIWPSKRKFLFNMTRALIFVLYRNMR